MNGSETTQDNTRGVRIPDGRKRAFLKLYRKNGLIAKTAKAIGLSHSGVDYWRAHDPDFAAE